MAKNQLIHLAGTLDIRNHVTDKKRRGEVLEWTKRFFLVSELSEHRDKGLIMKEQWEMN